MMSDELKQVDVRLKLVDKRTKNKIGLQKSPILR